MKSIKLFSALLLSVLLLTTSCGSNNSEGFTSTVDNISMYWKCKGTTLTVELEATQADATTGCIVYLDGDYLVSTNYYPFTFSETIGNFAEHTIQIRTSNQYAIQGGRIVFTGPVNSSSTARFMVNVPEE